MTTIEFENIKKIIEKRKNEKAKLEGELEAIKKQMKEKGFNSLKEVEKQIIKLNKRKDMLFNEIGDIEDQLINKFNIEV